MSNHRTGGTVIEILVGILSSSSRMQSLSWSQSLDSAPLVQLSVQPSSKWSQSKSALPSESSSSSIASGPVLGSAGLAIPEPFPKSSWSHGFVLSESNLDGQSMTSSSSFIPSASSSSSTSSLRPSLSWSQGVIHGVAEASSSVFTSPSPSQSLSAQSKIPSLSWSQGDCSSPMKQRSSCSASGSPLLSSSGSSPSGTPSLSLSTS